MPIKQVDYTTISYLLHTVKTIKKQFESCKSKIKQDIHIEETKQKNAAKIARKKQEMHQLIAENPGLDIDEELYLRKCIYFFWYSSYKNINIKHR